MISDSCMAALAANDISKYESFFTCRIPAKCVQMLKNGTDFGYALNHRLVII